ncbi:MAG: TIGR03435 family protein [Bryobacteraceae bacterium]
MPHNAKWVEVACILILGSRLGCGQAPAAPAAFEVASIKPSDPAETISIKRSGYHLATTSTSLEMLITWAYDIQSDRLYEKPKWLDSVRYDVVANAPEEGLSAVRVPGQPTRLQQMMQTLLAERFKLVIHRETRELPMYALVVAKNGLKVHLTEASGSMNQNPFSMPGQGRLIGTRVSAAMLAKALSSQLSRSVEDQTGLQGVFDFTLEWEPDTQATDADGVPTGAAEARTGASLFTALQDQLGLKLEPRKGQVEVLVIDHMERTPTEN